MEAQEKRTGRPRFRHRRRPAGSISVQVRAGRMVAGVPYRLYADRLGYTTEERQTGRYAIDVSWDGTTAPFGRLVLTRYDRFRSKLYLNPQEIRSLRRLDREPPGLSDFVGAYVACALWSSTDESTSQGGEPFDENYDAGDIDCRTLRRMTEDCRAFLRANRRHIRDDDIERAGRDFWLTRNCHGSNFLDGDWPEHDAEILANASHAFGTFDLYIGDDGRIHGT